jgi:prepilin-type N-terminal cleavage/methylation domain-containing protein
MKMRNRCHSRGLTLMELLVGVAILAILMAVGVPSLHDWIVRQRVKAIATELVTDLQLARSESITRNFGIQVSFKSDVSHSLTCYTIHTVGLLIPKCDCALGAGAACTGMGMTELKTVTVPSDSGVRFTPTLPSGEFVPVTFAANAAFTLAAVPVAVTISGGGTKTLVVATSAPVQRPQVCIPENSSMVGFRECPPSP